VYASELAGYTDETAAKAARAQAFGKPANPPGWRSERQRFVRLSTRHLRGYVHMARALELNQAFSRRRSGATVS
jgi:hypothetical protein